MARFDMDVGLDDFMQSLSSIDMEALAPVALEEASPIVKSKMVSLSEPHRDTGAMVRSIKAQRPKHKRDKYSLFVGPSGVDRRTGVRNMEKLAYLEYGVHGKQQATPVILPTIRATREQVLQRMQETFDRYMNSLDL